MLLVLDYVKSTILGNGVGRGEEEDPQPTIKALEEEEVGVEGSKGGGKKTKRKRSRKKRASSSSTTTEETGTGRSSEPHPSREPSTPTDQADSDLETLEGKLKEIQLTEIRGKAAEAEPKESGISSAEDNEMFETEITLALPQAPVSHNKDLDLILPPDSSEDSFEMVSPEALPAGSKQEDSAPVIEVIEREGSKTEEEETQLPNKEGKGDQKKQTKKKKKEAEESKKKAAAEETRKAPAPPVPLPPPPPPNYQPGLIHPPPPPISNVRVRIPNPFMHNPHVQPNSLPFLPLQAPPMWPSHNPLLPFHPHYPPYPYPIQYPSYHPNPFFPPGQGPFTGPLPQQPQLPASIPNIPIPMPLPINLPHLNPLPTNNHAQGTFQQQPPQNQEALAQLNGNLLLNLISNNNANKNGNGNHNEVNPFPVPSFHQLPLHLPSLHQSLPLGMNFVQQPTLLVPPPPQPMIPVLPDLDPQTLSPPGPWYDLIYSIREGKERPESIPLSFTALPFPEQVTLFMSTLAITQGAFKKRMDLLVDLKRTVQSYFPQCEIYPFGSFLTSLGDDSSDVDVYVNAFPNNRSPFPNSAPILEASLKVLGQAKIVFGPGPDEWGWLCPKIEALRQTRVPIIKFTHLNGVNCDVSFENIISVRNSLMIAKYMEVHPLVKPLLVFIRYWGKFHGLLGSQQIKSYGMVLLVLTFLMKTGLVPTVAQLQAKAREDFEVEDWDTSFSVNVDELKKAFPSRIPDSEEEQVLLGDIFLSELDAFFEFYGKEELTLKVVSPFQGDLLDRHLFSKAGMGGLPHPLGKKYKGKTAGMGRTLLGTGTSLVVQDPFVLNFNVGGVTPTSVLRKFQSACNKTKQLVREELQREEGGRNLLRLFERME